MSYYLFILSFHQHIKHMTSQILLILIDFDSFFRALFDLKLLIHLYNCGTRRDIKKRETVIFLIFAALSNSTIKKHFICTLNMSGTWLFQILEMKVYFVASTVKCLILLRKRYEVRAEVITRRERLP